MDIALLIPQLRRRRRNAVTMASGPISFDDPSTWTGALDRCLRSRHLRQDGRLTRGALSLGRPFRHEGLLGTVCTGHLVDEVEIAGRPESSPPSAARRGSPDSATAYSTRRTPSPTALLLAICRLSTRWSTHPPRCGHRACLLPVDRTLLQTYITLVYQPDVWSATSETSDREVRSLHLAVHSPLTSRPATARPSERLHVLTARRCPAVRNTR